MYATGGRIVKKPKKDGKCTESLDLCLWRGRLRTKVSPGTVQPCPGLSGGEAILT
jgi:hypothetical protein